MTPISLKMNGETLKQATIRHLNTYGYATLDTVELPMFTEYLEGLKSDREYWEEVIGADVDRVEGLFRAILVGDDNTILGNYNSKFYTFLNRGMREAAKKFRDNGIETRQAVVRFPKDHCFTSIQLIARSPINDDPRTSDKFNAYISVSMRSCNVVDNYVDDLYLAYLVAMHTIGLARNAVNNPLTIEYAAMCISIGSLHRFKEPKANK